ncbi:FMN-dependent oxidoreductase (nitrilotriacetate monooxygenase family) [Actinoplanes lutulentus]|uniref:FMN-dependent oxidoreductase (Nitrilotriacetate monooxygenase family) n=1 Tax=Actinoplanes lutulentus TaxID=1287878 RepID=A0A327ZKD3_9ACTN|nr:NtaA/DmoA family FMN-dependent monooxygenase [Actinoplanes lutulentus]MBB2940813.1 FMN-dependent oxidoreductase (nitrilotriacetate monooxygenase family) [Actinoplanes lutulentus]RAK43123.1 FMN-dependent oxidoreductase (nitrilotriacetate monooxygenase family) [Actinoplanes lutulentus]
MSDQLFLGGYVLFPSGHYAGAWRHPYSSRDWLGRGFIHEVARTLEAAKFDLAFIPETVSYRAGFVQHGLSNAIKHDPAQVAAQIAAVTTHLGIGVTLSTSFNEPYNLARTLASLDHLSGGRVAWNVIQSQGPANYANFPRAEQLSGPELYDRGDEFVEAVVALWKSWDADALVQDQETGVFADPSLISAPNYDGKYVSVAGPLNLPPTPQGHPVIIQAGDSPRGREFGARWGDVIFAIERTPADLRAKKDDLKAKARAQGRDADKIRLFAAVQPIIGETTSIARARRDFLHTRITPAAGVEFFSQFARIDFTGLAHDVSYRSAIEGHPWNRAITQLNELLGSRIGNISISEAAIEFSTSELTPQIVGTGVEVAEQLAEIFGSGAADGFLITPTHFPGSFEDFGRAVVPHLQRLGVYRKDYEGTTLRSHLGIA